MIIEKPHIGISCLLTGGVLENLLLWRPRAGEAFTVCSLDKKYFRARVTRLGSDSAEIFIFEEFYGSVESDAEITLLQAIPEKERMELIIQKTTELGVSSIIPFKSKRSISIEERDAKQKKSHKWGEIAVKAAKQCRRATIPQVQPCCSFADAVKDSSSHGLKLLLWENEKIGSLKQHLNGVKDLNSVSVIVGPEGGLEQSEVEEAKKAGFIPIGLGQRILRTETAAIIIVGLIQYELGNLG